MKQNNNNSQSNVFMADLFTHFYSKRHQNNIDQKTTRPSIDRFLHTLSRKIKQQNNSKKTTVLTQQALYVPPNLLKYGHLLKHIQYTFFYILHFLYVYRVLGI